MLSIAFVAPTLILVVGWLWHDYRLAKLERMHNANWQKAQRNFRILDERTNDD